jgi:hypothetical protein
LPPFLAVCTLGRSPSRPIPPGPNRSLDRLQVMIQNAGAQVALTHSTVLGGFEKRFQDYGALQRLQWLATDGVDVSLASAWQPPDAELPIA